MESMREVEMKTSDSSTALSNKSQNATGKSSHENLKQKKKLQNKLSKVESEISRLEHELINDDAAISDNFENVQQDANFFSLYQEKKEKLAELMQSWEDLHVQLDKM